MVDPLRDEEFGAQTKWRWTWKVYAPDGCKTWIGERQIKVHTRPNEAEAAPYEKYDYGACPFIRVKLADHQFLMDQIASPILEAFNLESDIASLCGKISNAQLVVESDQKDIGQVILPQLGVILIDRGGKAYFISPDSKCAEPLLKYKDVLRESIYNAINASAMRASADLIQNPRQAATAKAMDLEPWRAWSETFSSPVRTAFNKAFKMVAEFYGEEVPKIIWPDPLDISMGGINEAIGGPKDGKTQEELDSDSADGSDTDGADNKPVAESAA
jgi:hypothetical protein